MASGNKYHREIISVDGTETVNVDVYAVIEAFEVSCPARQHAIKKILCSGIRGKGDTIQDLTEAIDALERAVSLEKARTTPEGDCCGAAPDLPPKILSLCAGESLKDGERVCFDHKTYEVVGGGCYSCALDHECPFSYLASECPAPRAFRFVQI